MRKTWGTANLLKVFDTELSARQTHQQSAGKWVGWRNLLTPTFQKENNQIKSFFYIVPSFFCLFVYFLTFWRQVRPRWGLLGGLPPPLILHVRSAIRGWSDMSAVGLTASVFCRYCFDARATWTGISRPISRAMARAQDPLTSGQHRLLEERAEWRQKL